MVKFDTDAGAEKPAAHKNVEHADDNNDGGEEKNEDKPRKRKLLPSRSHRQRINFLDDPPEEMTYGRRIAMYLKENYAWYTETPKFSQKDELNELEATEEADKNDDSRNTNERTEVILTEQPTEDDDDDDVLLMQKAKEAAEGLEKALQAEAFSYPFIRSPNEEPPSLEKAWAYFEHYTLARYKVKEEDSAPTSNSRSAEPKPFVAQIVELFSKGSAKLERAQPGENTVKTRLYNPLWTPQSQLGDFGIGIGLLFANERALGIICLLALILNIPNMIYFASDEYNGDQSQDEISRWLLRGSAICANYDYVPVINSTMNQFEDNRVALAVDSAGNQADGVFFAIKNNCIFDDFQPSSINMGTLLLFAVGMIAMYRYALYQAKVFDEDNETAQDYSIVIQNPPRNAKDPDEWRAFFEGIRSELGLDDLQVKACTIGVANDELVKRLTERREKLRQLSALVDPGISLDPVTLERLAKLELKKRKQNPSFLPRLSPGIPELLTRIEKLNTKILYLTKKSYEVSNVFITFEKEKHKRVVLEKMAVSRAHARGGISTALPSNKCMFRNRKVLLIREAEEPSSVKWKHLNTSIEFRRFLTIASGFGTCLSLFLAVKIVNTAAKLTTMANSYLTVLFNVTFPIVATLLTDMEGHHSESDRQRSLYFKITVFLVGNMFFATWRLTPFTSTIADHVVDPKGLIIRLNGLFYAEITTTAFLQFSDFMGIVNRHILAPRAKTQDDMNFNMRGGSAEIAERYTSMTKLVFLALWGSAIYPGGFFMCWIAMSVKYWLDRLSLMRHWKRIPETGSETAGLTNKYVFAAALVVMAYVSFFSFAGFPYDNLCDLDETVPEEFHGSWTIRPKVVKKQSTLSRWYHGEFQEEYDTLVLDNTTSAFSYCLQDFRDFWRRGAGDPIRVETLLDHSIQGEQLIVIWIYGILANWAFIAGVLYFVIMGCTTLWSSYKYASHVRGRDQENNYSDLDDGIGIYIPQVESSQFFFPLLACNTDGFDERILDWLDPDRDYSYYDMTKDVERLLLGDILRLCDTVLGVRPEVLLKGLVENRDDGKKRYSEEDLQMEMEELLRRKVREYFENKTIFSIVREWHHCDMDNYHHAREANANGDEGIEVVDPRFFDCLPDEPSSRRK